jgi:hypothetical protein
MPESWIKRAISANWDVTLGWLPIASGRQCDPQFKEEWESVMCVEITSLRHLVVEYVYIHTSFETATPSDFTLTCDTNLPRNHLLQY